MQLHLQIKCLDLLTAFDKEDEGEQNMSNKLNSSQLQQNNDEQDASKSRIGAKEQEESEQKTIRWVRLRLFPIWLRVLIVLVLLVVVAIAGLIVGYSVIGDGQASDALKADTWQHILDIMQGKE